MWGIFSWGNFSWGGGGRSQCTSLYITPCTIRCIICIQIVCTGGDSNDKPTAMQSKSMAGIQCWTTVSIRTRSLGAPDVNSTVLLTSHAPNVNSIGTINIWCTPSNLVLIDTVVQHWLLAINSDRIAVGLSFESPPVRTSCKNWLSILIRGDSCITWRSNTNDTPTPSYSIGDAYQPWWWTVWRR